MKYLYTIISICVITQFSLAQASQPDSGRMSDLKYMDEICYTEDYTYRIRITSEFNPSTLSKMDKLKLTQKHYVRNHHEFINAAGHTTHDRDFVSHDNMFPAWYSHPTKIRSNQNGLTSYFHNNNEYLPSGWTGGSVDSTQHGVYQFNEANGERTLHQDYSAMAQERYQQHDSFVQTYGYLYDYVFVAPNSQELNAFVNLGFTVEVDSNLISVKNDTLRFAWDMVNKSFAHQTISNGSVQKTRKKYYSYYDFAEDFLISKLITTTPKTFDNGDCYDIMTQTLYTNYMEGCASGLDSMSKQASQGKIRELSVYPNPTSSYLVLTIPPSNETSVIHIYNMTGTVVKEIDLEADTPVYELNTSSFEEGMYIIRVQQGTNLFSSKFVKQ